MAIDFREAIPIACLGLAVNVASAWLLGAGGHDHGHGHSHGHCGSYDAHADHEETRRIATPTGSYELEVHEDGVPPRFRLRADTASIEALLGATIQTVRPDGDRRTFAMTARGGYLESIDEIPEPHAFEAHVRIGGETHVVEFEEHDHADAKGAAQRDNNMRAAVVHVVADAAVSMLVIVGLLLARVFGWTWMDPLAGIAGAVVIASLSYGLIRDTGAILLDMNPEPELSARMRQTLETDGDRVADLHVWRLGPGHLGAIVSMLSLQARDVDYYRDRLSGFRSLSHLTIEVQRR